MKLLVTGAAGFLGSEIVRQAAGRRAIATRALVRPASDCSPLEGLDIELAQGDMTDAGSLARAAEGVDAVIHCAATTSEGAPDLELSREVNVEGNRRLIEALGNSPTVRWIQISSMSAHPETTSVYGRTKLEADEVLRASNVRWTILRPSIIYGPGNKGLVAKTVRIMRKLPVMPVVGSGRELLRPILTSDVARAALNCLGADKTIGQSYTLGGADEISFNDFLTRLGAAAGVKRLKVHLPIWAALIIARALGLLTSNPPLTVDNVLGVKQVQPVDIEPALRDFGFSPMTFKEGLRETFDAAPK